MRKQIPSPFILSSFTLWFSKFQLCCRMGKREKAVKKASGWELSRKKSISAVCAVRFEREMLHSLNRPGSKRYRETGRCVGGWEGGEETGQRAGTRRGHCF